MFTRTLAVTALAVAGAFAASKSAANANSGFSNPDNVPDLNEASELDGSTGLGFKDGDALSKVSDNNFENFCDGLTLTNGLQNTAGSCNVIPIGKIPAKNKMVSSIILNPQTGQVIPSGQTFDIIVGLLNLDAGSFTNADTTYYGAPQDLNPGGIITGHTHVTVQSLGNSLNPSTPPDPALFSFFKGIDFGPIGGTVNATVSGGLPPGHYRVCTLSAASNHQPVVMPVAQRGAQDDCTKFIVNGNNDTVNANANNGSAGLAGAELAQSAVNLGPGAVTTGQAAAATVANNAAEGSAKGGKSAKTTTAKPASSTSNSTPKKAPGRFHPKGKHLSGKKTHWPRA